MDLMDWKNVEAGAESQIRDAKVQQVIGEILLQAAHTHIKRLHGLTNGEEEANTKKEIERQRKRTT